MTTTRRNLLTTALATAVVPTLAIAATAVAPADPIFAALDARRNTYAAFQGVCDARNALASKLSPDVRRDPRVRYANLFLTSHEEIDRLIDQIISIGFGSRSHYEQLRAELHAALDADAAEVEKAQEAAGLTARIAAGSVGRGAQAAATMGLTNTPPTTITAAKASPENNNQPFCGREPDEFLATIIRGLKALA